MKALHLFASLVRFGGCGGMGGDCLTRQRDGDGAGRKQAWLWAGETPESESNLDVDRLRNVGIDIGPGFRVKPRGRPDHAAFSSRFVPKAGSNRESDPAAPIRYDIGLARRGVAGNRSARRGVAGTAAPGGEWREPQRQAGSGGSRSARRGVAGAAAPEPLLADPGFPHRCRNRNVRP